MAAHGDHGARDRTGSGPMSGQDRTGAMIGPGPGALCIYYPRRVILPVIFLFIII